MNEPIRFARLAEIEPECIIELMNDPDVRRHLPLAQGHFGPTDCVRFVNSKERMWQEHGFGPWAFVKGNEFIGWGGLQPEGDDADVGLVLRPDHWGVGRSLYKRIISFAFHELGLESVIALLPVTRSKQSGLFRLGFQPDGEVLLRGVRFVRYRLRRAEGSG